MKIMLTVLLLIAFPGFALAQSPFEANVVGPLTQKKVKPPKTKKGELPPVVEVPDKYLVQPAPVSPISQVSAMAPATAPVSASAPDTDRVRVSSPLAQIRETAPEPPLMPDPPARLAQASAPDPVDELEEELGALEPAPAANVNTSAAVTPDLEAIKRYFENLRAQITRAGGAAAAHTAADPEPDDSAEEESVLIGVPAGQGLIGVPPDQGLIGVPNATPKNRTPTRDEVYHAKANRLGIAYDKAARALGREYDDAVRNRGAGVRTSQANWYKGIAPVEKDWYQKMKAIEADYYK